MTLIPLRPNSPISDVVAQLNGFRDLIGDDAYLQIRTVTIRHGGLWWNHATTIVLEPGNAPGPHAVVTIRDVACVEVIVPLAGDLTVEAFKSAITGWRRIIGARPASEFQEPVSVDRQSSRPPQIPYPEWTCRLHELVTNTPSGTHPSGPFLAPEHHIFAPDVERLTADWLGEPFWASRTNLTYEYRLRIQDRRARLLELTAEGNGVTVTVEAMTPEPLYCGALVKTLAGNEQTHVAPVVASKAHFDLGESVQNFSTWVMLGDGQPLDSYEETPRLATWGAERALFNRPRSSDVAARTPLDVALMGGETQNVEFKPFIRLNPREKKSDELLETVCAFSNADGGSVFLGVTDYADPVGIDTDLRKLYGQRCAADAECLKDSYAKDLKRLFQEGLIPAIIPAFVWHELAHRWILAILVGASDSYVCLGRTGEIFKRVGATNRKVRTIDIATPSEL